MKIIIVLIFLLTLLIVGCTTDTESDEVSTEVISAVKDLFSEENWGRMEQLFETVEVELVDFVDYLEEHNLTEVFEGSEMRFPAVYNGEIVAQRNRAQVTILMRDDPEWFGIMSEISEQGVIADIFITEHSPNIWITFAIEPEKTPLTSTINAGINFFHYIDEEGVDFTQYGFRRIKDRWYMEISPPHGFH